MKRYLAFLIFLFGTVACSQKPNPPQKSTMDPVNAQATTVAFVATRSAETAMPTATTDSADFVTLICAACVTQGVDITIWEFAGSNPGKAMTSAPDNTTVALLDIVTADDGRTWYKVRLNGISGWVAQDFVRR